MIPRYARAEMTSLWEAESRFSIWLDIETHAMDAMVDIGIVPAEAAKAVHERRWHLMKQVSCHSGVSAVLQFNKTSELRRLIKRGCAT